MSAIFSSISALSGLSGPALTWYSPNLKSLTVSQREELGGPVVARWLAKIANLLGTDLADLFGAGNTSRSIEIDLPATWQEQVWALGASLMGWEGHLTPAPHLIPTPNLTSAPHLFPTPGLTPAAGLPPAPGQGEHVAYTQGNNGQMPTAVASPPTVIADVYVTNRETPRAHAYLDAGCDVLFHHTAPLALSWNEELPVGAMDALEAIMSQPDALMVDLSPALGPIHEATVGGHALPEGAAQRLLLTYPAQGLAHTLATLWAQGGSAVMVPQTMPGQDRLRIADTERATLPTV